MPKIISDDSTTEVSSNAIRLKFSTQKPMSVTLVSETDDVSFRHDCHMLLENFTCIIPKFEDHCTLITNQKLKERDLTPTSVLYFKIDGHPEITELRLNVKTAVELIKNDNEKEFPTLQIEREAKSVSFELPAHTLHCLEQLQHGGKHYKDDGVQPIMYGQMNAMKPMEYSAVKYISRHHQKGGAEDLKKAIHFLQMALEFEYGIVSEVEYKEPKEKK